MPSNVLKISNLTKKYGGFVAVDGFNLELQQGTVHGLVGPNGAGKSTMLSIISGLRRKTSGRVEYDEIYVKLSKTIVDKIDFVLAKHYGFTDEELDFIINYDIKYRMGLDGG